MSFTPNDKRHSVAQRRSLLTGGIYETQPSRHNGLAPMRAVAKVNAAPNGAQCLLPTRPSKQALEEAKLESPFEHRRHEYHTSQQDALNAQLRQACEAYASDWGNVVTKLRHQLESYPSRAGTFGMMTFNSMLAYDEGYGCTEDLSVTQEQLVSNFKLLATTEDLAVIKNWPTLQGTLIGRTLDSLLNSQYLLSPLNRYMKDLEALDGIADVEAAKAAVALHEKLHYNVSQYALAEISKSDLSLQVQERKVLEAKARKEEAIETSHVVEAVENLTLQVDHSNSLLKMNKARMALLDLHGKDVEGLKKDVKKLLETAREIAAVLEERIVSKLPSIRSDMETVRKDTELSREQLEQTKKNFEEMATVAKDEYRKMEQHERNLWQQICDMMDEIDKSSHDRQKLMFDHMVDREVNSRQQLMTREIIAAQQAHYKDLERCEDTVLMAQKASELYKTFIEAFDSKLQNKVIDAENADRDLRMREAMEYVRRYELFDFGVEEARAKRQGRCDLLDMQKRSKLLDIECAEETLDPNLGKYLKEADDINSELEQVKAYVSYVKEMGEDRHNDVDPYVKMVVAFRTREALMSTAKAESAKRIELEKVASKRGSEPEQSSYRRSLQSTPSQDDADGSPVRGYSRQRSPAMDGAAASDHHSGLELQLHDFAEEDVQQVCETMPHPHVAARSLGIRHESTILQKTDAFVGGEQKSVEQHLTNIRLAKAKIAQSVEDSNLRAHRSYTM